jgi:hypothetical protein
VVRDFLVVSEMLRIVVFVYPVVVSLSLGRNLLLRSTPMLAMLTDQQMKLYLLKMLMKPKRSQIQCLRKGATPLTHCKNRLQSAAHRQRTLLSATNPRDR